MKQYAEYDDAYIKPAKQKAPITILLTKAKKETSKAQIKMSCLSTNIESTF
jgi:hypothetical protein